MVKYKLCRCKCRYKINNLMKKKTSTFVFFIFHGLLAFLAPFSFHILFCLIFSFYICSILFSCPAWLRPPLSQNCQLLWNFPYFQDCIEYAFGYICCWAAIVLSNTSCWFNQAYHHWSRCFNVNWL